MKTILVPTDFSKNAHNACIYAIEFAKTINAKIILMYVYETPLMYADAPMMAMPIDYSLFRSNAINELDSYFKKIKKISGDIEIESVLEEGMASEKIREIAAARKADLIIIGSTGKGAMERIMMGSNASGIIAHANCLVFTIPAKVKFKGITSIIYATDLTDENLVQANKIIPFAKAFNAEICFLYVNTHVLGAGENDLKDIVKKIKKQVSYQKFSAYLCNDVNAANGINYFLKKHKADCLAMYTHHRSWLMGLINPSITKSVALHTIIPLLAIHKKDHVI